MNRQLNLDKGINFLTASIDASTKGSAAFYSRLYFPFKGWSATYPETSGYLISTLFNLSTIKSYYPLKESAIEMSNWIASLQTTEGGLPGGLYNKTGQMELSIFNTAQMMIGLVSANEFTGEDRFLKVAHRAGKWLSDTQEKDGTWNKHHYNKDFFPSYYTRVAWPMLQVAKITSDKKMEAAAIKTFDYILSKVQANKMIIDAGFKPNSYAFLHTIAYTIRGFLEGAILLDRSDYWQAAYDLAYKLLRKYELKKQLAGAYYENFKEVNWYRCLTGEAQLAIIWLKIFERTGDIRFVNSASKLLDELCAIQPKKNSFFLKSGGLQGSLPYYGRYISFRQPNWATKFFVDALLLEEQAYHKIKNKRSFKLDFSY